MQKSIVLSLLLLGFTFISSAASAASEMKILDQISPKQFVRLLADAGFGDAKIDEDGDVFVDIEGRPVLVLLGSHKNLSAQFRYSVSGTKANLRSINDWNRKKRFGRAYMHDGGDARLVMDLDFEGGVTEARCLDAIKTFSMLMTSFIAELKELE